METSGEVQRLKAVYQDYAQRDFGNSKWSPAQPGNRAIVRERTRTLGKLLQKGGFLPLSNRRILDVGCGMGGVLANLEDWGAKPENLFGVDLLPGRIRLAKQRFPAISFQEANAEALPFADGTFDLVLLFTVFTSILNREMAANVSREVKRILRSGGAIVWYDFRMNNPFNPAVRGFSWKDIRKLFPEFHPRLKTVTLLPPLARGLGLLADWLYPGLVSLPFLRSHYLGLLVKP